MRTAEAICLAALLCAAHAQTFEAASVKPAPPLTPAVRNHINTGGPGTADPGRVDWWHVSMLGFLTEAYDLKPFQISAPDWVTTTAFQLAATVPKGATRQQYRLMLQNLLADRFHMQAHMEKKASDVYVLTIARDGPKLKDSTARPIAADEAGPPATAAELTKDADGFVNYPWLHDVVGSGPLQGRARFFGNRATMSQLIDKIKFMFRVPVRDETGLHGQYDFVLTYAPPMAHSAAASTAGIPEPDIPAAPDIVAAMSQLGLKLQLKKQPVDMLVVDHLEKLPTEN